MDIIPHWQVVPKFPEAAKSEWERLKGAIHGNSFAGKCHVGDEDYGNQIVLNIVDLEGESLGIIRYTKGELARVSYQDLSLDLKVVTDLRKGKHTKLLNIVFKYYLQNHEWPNSLEMSVNVSKLGFFFDMVDDIGPEYIRVAHRKRKDSITRLTVRGVSLCNNSITYLSVFKHALTLLVKRYKQNPKSPVITTSGIIESGLIATSDESMFYWMIIQEEGLVAEVSTNSHYTNAQFTISDEILRYNNVTSIKEYLRLQQYGESQGEVTTLPVDVVEFTSEGVQVSTSRPEKEHKYDIFISYSHVNEMRANEIKEKALEYELNAFLSEKDIESGAKNEDEIKKSLRGSREVAFLMTPESIKSEWVIKEWGAAWILDKRSTPILYRCDISQLPTTLPGSQARDFSDLDRYFKEVIRRKNAP